MPAATATGTSSRQLVRWFSPSVRHFNITVAAVLLLAALGCADDDSPTPPPNDENAAPVASFVVATETVAANVAILVDASGSTDDQDLAALEVRWDWEDDGTWDTGFSTEKTAGHAYTTSGTKRIRLEVRDAGGLTASVTRGIEVTENDPPTAAFEVNPSMGDLNTVFELDASGSSDAQDDASALEARWDFDGDGAWDTEFQASLMAAHDYEVPGSYSIRLEVRDQEGATATSSRQVVVFPISSEAMVLVAAGPFVMGSDPGEGYDDERPERRPSISAFWIGTFEVSNARCAEALRWALQQGEIEVVPGSPYGSVHRPGGEALYLDMDAATLPKVIPPNECRITFDNGSFGVEPGWEDHPVVGVSWFGAAAFCNWLSAADGLAPCYDVETWTCDFNASGYRLPTEAEWEKAARGTTDEREYSWGNNYDCAHTNGWSCVRSTVPVDDPAYWIGASPYGCLHMIGNVSEWCQDWYDRDYYQNGSGTNPRGPASGSRRVVRGGSFADLVPEFLRCSYRDVCPPSGWLGDSMKVFIGFRPVRRAE